jgi:hypothetical protein
MSGVKIFAAGPDVWRPVLGYEGFYEVSGAGQVRSLPRTITYPTGRVRTYRGQLMEQKPDRRGRRCVKLTLNGQPTMRYVSVLALEAFHGPRPEGTEAAHRNDNASDDRIGNLHWTSHQINCFERTANGRDADANKTHCKHGHAFTEENTRVRIEGSTIGRICLQCVKIRNDANYASVKASRNAEQPST